eukprot:3284764-Pleurochrysis_carterae.AAC.1
MRGSQSINGRACEMLHDCTYQTEQIVRSMRNHDLLLCNQNKGDGQKIEARTRCYAPGDFTSKVCSKDGAAAFAAALAPRSGTEGTAEKPAAAMIRAARRDSHGNSMEPTALVTFARITDAFKAGFPKTCRSRP